MSEITREELHKHFNSRFDDIRALCKARSDAGIADEDMNAEDRLEEAERIVDEGVLSVDIQLKITVLLGFGGPSDGYDLYFDPEGNPLYGEYWYQWAGPKAVYDLSESELNAVLEAYRFEDPYLVLEFVRSKLGAS